MESCIPKICAPPHLAFTSPNQQEQVQSSGGEEEEVLPYQDFANRRAMPTYCPCTPNGQDVSEVANMVRTPRRDEVVS